jgi:hypothetical protein
MDLVITHDWTGNNRNIMGKKLMISDELASEKGIDRQICSAEIVKESSSSYQLNVAKIEDNYHWIPKSKVVISAFHRSDLFFMEYRVFELYHEVNSWRKNQKETGVLTTIDAVEYSQMTGDSYDNVNLVITTGNAVSWRNEVPVPTMLAMYDKFWMQG